MATTTQIKKAFFEQGLEIAYRCWGYEGGRVIAKWDALRGWMHRHETDSEWSLEGMSEARAGYFFPTDAVLA